MKNKPPLSSEIYEQKGSSQGRIWMKALILWVILVILAGGIWLRVGAFGDLRLSVSNSLTGSYISSSEVNLWSWEAFTSTRPYTTNLVFHLFKPPNGYTITAYSSYAAGTTHRRLNKGFENLALFQVILSIISWTGLAWVVSVNMKKSIVKWLSAGVIILFGFTPQLADWDSIIGSESLSISLFITGLAALTWFLFSFSQEPKANPRNMVAIGFFILFMFLWAYVRDVNVYALFFIGIWIGGLYTRPDFRKTKMIPLACLIIFSLFLLGYITTRQRAPLQMTMKQVWESDIVSSPSRMGFFTDRGMPEYGSPEFAVWFEEHAPSMYLLFLLSHPGYTTQNFFEDMNWAFAENIQPYFRAKDVPARQNLIILGNYLHPRDGAVFVIDILLLIILWEPVLSRREPALFPWAWILTLSFIIATATMFFSIFGDVVGLHRHTLSSVTTYRLLMWLLILVFADHAFLRSEPTNRINHEARDLGS